MRVWNARGGEGLPVKPPRNQADPATSAQLEELFADWTRALWAIDFFKTRRPESVMRSFREMVFRADLDGREASLVRAMGIEVVRYLERHRRGILMGRSSAYWTLESVHRRSGGAGADGPADRPLCATGGAVSSLTHRAARDRGVAEQVRFMGPMWRWAWEYGIGQSEAVLAASHARAAWMSPSRCPRATRAGSAKGPKLAKALARAIDGRPANRSGQMVLAGAGGPAGGGCLSQPGPAKGGMARGAARPAAGARASRRKLQQRRTEAD